MIRTAVCSLLLVSTALAAAREPAPPPREKVKFGEWRTGERKKKLLADGGGDEKTEKAVADALKWLAPRQQDDGTWRFDTYGSISASSTGFVLLCFFGSGHAPGDGGDYGKRLADGVAALLKEQDPKTGLIRSPAGGGAVMYEHAISTLALVEAYGLSGDEKLREPCERAVDLIVKSQHRDGGWRYEPVPHYAGDVSISGWVIQALTAARLARLDVPDAVLDRANKFLDGCARGEKKGTFAYVAYATYSPTSACTASGACSKLAVGAWSPDDEALGVAVAEILKRLPEKDKPADAYFLYYATRAVYCRGGDDWSKTWNPAVRDYLLGTQKADGSWPTAGGQYGRTFGAVGATCLHVLTLQTYYRSPPPKK